MNYLALLTVILGLVAFVVNSVWVWSVFALLAVIYGVAMIHVDRRERLAEKHLDLRYDPLAMDECIWIPITSRTCTRCGREIAPDDLSDCIAGKEVPGAGLEPHVFRSR